MDERTDFWSVRLPVSLEESSALANAYWPTLEDEPWGAEFGGWLESEFEPEPYFTVVLRADSANEASAKAKAQLARMRLYCDLEIPGSTQVLWVAPLGRPDAPQFLAQAKDLFDQDYFELAVVAAQIHFEHHARLALTRVATRPGAPLWARRLAKGKYGALHEPTGLAVIELLVGEDLGAASAWADFKKHIDLRNKIVHRGVPATREEAARSIKAVQAIWLQITVAAFPPA